jgi:nitroreductase
MQPFSSSEHASGVSVRLTALEILDVLRAAHRAPSVHNTQPWLFRPLPDGVEVLEDVERALPASDPHGRDRLVSCGAAVRNAEIALARLGWRPSAVLFPAGSQDHLVARVVAGPAQPVTAESEDLYRAIWERRTHRRIFMAGAQEEDVPPLVHRAAKGVPEVRLVTLPAHRRARFAELLWEAAQQQVADEERRAEILRWTKAPAAGDGIPARSLGNAPFPVDSLLVRTLPPEDSAPPWITESLASGPVVVLLTDGDDRPDWVRAGLALESVLLAGTAAGLVASFLNQVVQQEACRPTLTALLGEVGHPQVVLRIGQPLVDVPLTPRRPLIDVTLGWPQP